MTGPASKTLAIWNGVIVASLLIAVTAFALNFAMPKPGLKLSPTKRVEREEGAKGDAKAWQAKLEEARATIDARVWTEEVDAIQTKAMALASKLAQDAKVSLNAFRPQKSSENGGLLVIPFLISLEGPYPNVVRLLESLETPANKIAVNLVQLTSADGASDTVTATVGVLAFKEIAEKKAPPTQSTPPKAAGGA